MRWMAVYLRMQSLSGALHRPWCPSWVRPGQLVQQGLAAQRTCLLDTAVAVVGEEAVAVLLVAAAAVVAATLEKDPGQ